ncbi:MULTISPECIES: hypothetical protein [unclassified Methylobacterium]|jgi:hypothetical protein|nr:MULTISPECIES: hypothetical protein [unclassified Methylobacterium]MBO1019221.1 hypothetical protein [Methylobacterium sp. SD274]
MAPIDKKPSPVKSNRFGLIAAGILFAALVAYAIYFISIPSPLPPQ